MFSVKHWTEIVDEGADIELAEWKQYDTVEEALADGLTLFEIHELAMPRKTEAQIDAELDGFELPL